MLEPSHVVGIPLPPANSHMTGEEGMEGVEGNKWGTGRPLLSREAQDQSSAERRTNRFSKKKSPKPIQIDSRLSVNPTCLKWSDQTHLEQKKKKKCNSRQNKHFHPD